MMPVESSSDLTSYYDATRSLFTGTAYSFPYTNASRDVPG